VGFRPHATTKDSCARVFGIWAPACCWTAGYSALNSVQPELRSSITSDKRAG